MLKKKKKTLYCVTLTMKYNYSSSDGPFYITYKLNDQLVVGGSGPLYDLQNYHGHEDANTGQMPILPSGVIKWFHPNENQIPRKNQNENQIVRKIRSKTFFYYFLFLNLSN